MGDLFGLLATLLLVGANAFFVAAEFSLISARRDRLEALAEQGRSSAVTAMRAGEQLPLMFAGAQLGITVSSILLGRLGEPAVADLLRRPFDLFGISPALLHTLSFVIALAIVVTRACPARRNGAEEHRDRRAGEGGDAADSGLPGLRARGPAGHHVLQPVQQRHLAGAAGRAPATSSTSRSRPSSSAR